MKLSLTTTLLLLLSTAVEPRAIMKRQSMDLLGPVEPSAPKEPIFVTLEKRKGGGGGGGGGRSGGGGGGRSGSGGSRTGGSSSSSAGGSRGGSGGGGGSTSSNSNRGGSTRSGSGRQPTYGGGAYYAGGAMRPYSAGGRSPGGLTPYLLPAAALTALPAGALLYGAYAYPYSHDYHYTDQHTHNDKSLPVVCVCDQYSECGCDDNNNSTYYESLFNGTQPTNSSNVQVLNVNGTEKIYINGTLPNGTTVASSATPATVRMVQHGGYWVMVAVVASAVWVL